MSSFSSLLGPRDQSADPDAMKQLEEVSQFVAFNDAIQTGEACLGIGAINHTSESAAIVSVCQQMIGGFHHTYNTEYFNNWGGRGHDDSVPGDGAKTTPSGDRTT